MDLNLARENERLRRESRILRRRGKSQKGNAFLRGSKTMRFRFSEEYRDAFCAQHMCDVLDVSARGLRAYRNRPASRRQRSDMIILTHIKEQFRLSLGSYGQPRMTEEFKEFVLNIGHRRVGRLMRENGIQIERSKKFKVPTDSNHACNIASKLLNRDFHADLPNRNWAGDISYVWPAKPGFISR
jgi:hypothetical protein